MFINSATVSQLQSASADGQALLPDGQSPRSMAQQQEAVEDFDWPDGAATITISGGESSPKDLSHFVRGKHPTRPILKGAPLSPRKDRPENSSSNNNNKAPAATSSTPNAPSLGHSTSRGRLINMTGNTSGKSNTPGLSGHQLDEGEVEDDTDTLELPPASSNTHPPHSTSPSKPPCPPPIPGCVSISNPMNRSCSSKLPPLSSSQLSSLTPAGSRTATVFAATAVITGGGAAAAASFGRGGGGGGGLMSSSAPPSIFMSPALSRRDDDGSDCGAECGGADADGSGSDGGGSGSGDATSPSSVMSPAAAAALQNRHLPGAVSRRYSEAPHRERYYLYRQHFQTHYTLPGNTQPTESELVAENAAAAGPGAGSGAAAVAASSVKFANSGPKGISRFRLKSVDAAMWAEQIPDDGAAAGVAGRGSLSYTRNKLAARGVGGCGGTMAAAAALAESAVAAAVPGCVPSGGDGLQEAMECESEGDEDGGEEEKQQQHGKAFGQFRQSMSEAGGIIDQGVRSAAVAEEGQATTGLPRSPFRGAVSFSTSVRSVASSPGYFVAASPAASRNESGGGGVASDDSAGSGGWKAAIKKRFHLMKGTTAVRPT